jgi:hypothetical protein
MTHLPFSSLIKHLCVSVWLMSHFKTSMQEKMGVLLSTICRYDIRMFENTWLSSALTSRSLCGKYSGYSSRLILLNISPHCRRATLDLVLESVLPKAKG